MKYGFVKIALASPGLKVGAPDVNVSMIKKAVDAAAKKGTEIIVFGEMSVTGSTLGSMLYYDSLLKSAEDAVRDLIEFSAQTGCVIVVGAPVFLNKKIHSAALVIHGGKLKGISVKDSSFVAGNLIYAGFECPAAHDLLYDIDSLKLTFGVALGEDFDNISPLSQKLAATGAELIVNISASKALIDSFSLRQKKLTMLSKRLTCAYVYVSTGKGESVAKNVYCGDMIAAEDGEIVSAAEGGGGDIMFCELDIDAVNKARKLNDTSFFGQRPEIVIKIDAANSEGNITRAADNLPFVPDSWEFERIFNIMGRGIYARMQQSETDKVIFGFSGGLDSTMTLIACEKLFKKRNLSLKNITAVTMSGHGTGARSKNNAKALVSALGVTNIDIPIVAAVDAHLEEIKHYDRSDEVFENTQARERAQILMDLSDKHGALMLGTADLSEIALGWSVFGGDQLAQYNPNSSLAKTLIRAIMRNYCLTSTNAEAARIVNDILAMPVSTELMQNRETEKLIGPFELHDFFLYNLIGKGFSIEKVVCLCRLAYPDFSEKVILKHLKTFVIRFFKNHFQRNAGCDGIQVTEFDLSDKIIYSEYSDEIMLAEIERLMKKA